MTQKWKLQDIKLNSSSNSRVKKRASSITTKKRRRPLNNHDLLHKKNEREPKTILITDKNKSRKKKSKMAILFLLSVIGIFFLFGILFQKTIITVTPKTASPNIDAKFTAYSESGDDKLTYEIRTLELTGEGQVKATGKTEVEEKAAGIIEIVKTTPGNERLIKNTRFRTQGMIYRAQESVVVPGAKKNKKDELIPGKVRIEVFADEAGEKYNINSGASFDIPGFQESGLKELYNSIKATNPEPFSGGFIGPQFEIDDTELASTKQAIQVNLKNSLLEQAKKEKLANFLSFPNSYTITYESLPALEYKNDIVTIREKAILQIPFFSEEKFAEFLAAQSIPDYKTGEKIRINDSTKLTFSYVSTSTLSTKLTSLEKIDFKLTGKPLFIWKYDKDKLKADLAGTPKKSIYNIMPAYSGIESIKSKIRPFWKRRFSKDLKNIELIESVDTNR